MANMSDKPKIKPVPTQPSEPVTNKTKGVSEIWGKFDTVVKKTSRYTAAIGVIAVMILVLVIGMDVVGSKVLHAPVPGSVGVLGFVQLIAISFGMGATYLAGMHIKVEIILNRFPKRSQEVVNTLVYLLGFLLFVLIVWRMLVLARSFQSSGEVLDQILIPMYPIVYAVAIAFVPVCLALFYQLGNSINRMVRK